MQNKKMAEILRANEENISLMEALIAKQAEEKDHLELHRDTHLLEKEDLHSSVSYLEQRIQEMQDELRVSDIFPPLFGLTPCVTARSRRE